MFKHLVRFASLLFVAAGHASAAIVTFDPPQLPGGSAIVSQWIELGFRISTPQGLVSNDISSGLWPSNGSAYLQTSGADAPLTIEATDSSPFDLLSIDLAEYSLVYSIPKSVTFVGTTAGGSTVDVTFVTDGIIGSTGPQTDFQTFTFPSTFTNLVQVSTSDTLFSLDNVQAEVVPEPTTFALWSAGGILLLTRKRRRKKHVSIV